jgi:ADP-heptose:LPS heptosyltransferase
MKIAILRALYLGDMLLAIPALRAIRSGYPGAEITLISLPWAEALAARLGGYVDRFLPFPGYPGLEEQLYEKERAEAFIAEQRAYRYDLVIQMHGKGGTSNPFALALGGGATAGYYEGEPPPGLSVGAPYPDHLPEVLRNLRLARLVGCPETDPALEFPLTVADRREAVTLLAGLRPGGRPLIALHPGSKRPTRRWPPARFAAAADLLVAHLGARIILTGALDERALAAEVERRMETEALNLAGRTTLGGLAAVMQAADLVIANDTGPAHLAEAVGTPLITIFGPGDHLRWAPLDARRFPTIRHPVPCSPCEFWDCPIDHRCLTGIEPAEVVAVAEQLLVGATPCSA